MLITGGNGALGIELKKIFPDSVTPDHKELDITQKKKVLEFFEKNDIDIVIHAAALTKIRPCEENKELAWKTNVEGTKNLVEAILSSNKKIRLIYVSTACIFDGHSGMYKEDSVPYPENFYALTKLIGEHEISKLSDYLIIRTNFVPKKIWEYPKAFTDRFGTYLFAQDVAQGIFDVQKEKLEGIVHIVGDKKISMYELAKITTPDIKPMTIKDYSGPNLTMDMSLDTERWKKYKISN
jgi:dTDP-4-dehydrorhamnose reductase